MGREFGHSSAREFHGEIGRGGYGAPKVWTSRGNGVESFMYAWLRMLSNRRASLNPMHTRNPSTQGGTHERQSHTDQYTQAGNRPLAF